MNDFSELINFINNNSDWEKKLKSAPYCLKSIKKSVQNPNWYILMYNLFERNSLSYKEVLASRGTVVEVIDGKAKIICAPFYKFFNYGEGLEEKIDFSNSKTFILNKRDGWIVKASKVNGKLYWWTQSADLVKENSKEVEPKEINGLSFKTIYDVWEYAWNCESHDFVDKLPDGCTLIFELESAWNEIHTKSQIEPKLWFIGYRDENLMEHRVDELSDIVPFEIPKHYELSSWKDIKALLDTWDGNELEGIVACEPMENGHFKRVKIKCDSYLAIKMIAHAGEIVPTTRNIFNIVMKGEYDDFLSNPVASPLIIDMVKRIENLKVRYLNIYNEMISNVDLSKGHDLAKVDCVNWLKKHYGYTNTGVVISAFDSDFETSWNDLMDKWEYSTKVAWKRFISYEKSIGL